MTVETRKVSERPQKSLMPISTVAYGNVQGPNLFTRVEGPSFRARHPSRRLRLSNEIKERSA
jgi:hypothetical protein